MTKIYDVRGKLVRQELSGRMNDTHLAMMDYIIEHPGYTTAELSVTFKRTVGWIASILNSDSFRVRLAERRAQVLTPRIQEKLDNLVDPATQVLTKQMQSKNPSTALNAALKSLAFSAEIVEKLAD